MPKHAKGVRDRFRPALGNSVEQQMVDGYEAAASASQQVVNDLEGVVDAASLGAIEGGRLRAIVIGATGGNRDLPLFLLAKALAHYLSVTSSMRVSNSLFDLLALANRLPRTKIGKLNLALLDFLASMDGYRHFEAISEAYQSLSASPHEASAIKACTSKFAACLYRYRAQYLPAERHRSQFNDIRQYLRLHYPNEPLPRDGSALEFWCREASRSRWTLYETVLYAMISYLDSVELVRATGSVVNLDDPKGLHLADDQAQYHYGSLDDVLDEAIDVIATAKLKIFKRTELSDLQRFAHLGRHALSWARSSLTLFAFGPFQSSLVQFERQGDAAGQGSQLIACEGGASYVDIKDRMASYLTTVNDCLALAVGVEPDAGTNENAANHSTLSNKASAMMRRKSFSGLEQAEFRAELERLEPALGTVGSALARLVRSWGTRLKAGSDGGFADDRTRFAAKLAALYLSNEKSDGR
ncbi:hypothetical protein [Mesorhizobium sp. KR9-304]|uniref:hypothetical protein n=1 Tax=Mesorhizobium sp. KR9-304 TaxID=3156614 RepID=UPI0032B618C4